MASALFIIFMVARMALVLYLPSLALTAVTGIDIYICIVLMALIQLFIAPWVVFEAVVWGDGRTRHNPRRRSVFSHCLFGFLHRGRCKRFLHIAPTWEVSAL